MFHKKYLGGYKLVKGYSSVPSQNDEYSYKIEVDNFIYHSIKVYFDKTNENKSIKMFLYSIIYLYVLFLSMVIDYLILSSFVL